MYTYLQVVTYAAIGGVIPCLFWLVFWLRENKENPEPPKIILACFVAGMITTLLVFPFEYVTTLFLKENSGVTFGILAFIEEIAKFIVCYFIALRTRYERRPIDAVIYMVTVALGFAALENTFFLINTLSQGDVIGSVITGNLRFIGASLLHTLASASIGVFIAFSFYKSKFMKEKYLLCGILFAGILHTLFNFFILQDSGSETFFVFAIIWLLVVALIITLEKVKVIKFKTS